LRLNKSSAHQGNDLVVLPTLRHDERGILTSGDPWIGTVLQDKLYRVRPSIPAYTPRSIDTINLTKPL